MGLMSYSDALSRLMSDMVCRNETETVACHSLQAASWRKRCVPNLMRPILITAPWMVTLCVVCTNTIGC